MVDLIPPSAPVVATFGFTPKLSMRPRLAYFYHIYASPRKPEFGLYIPQIQKNGEYALIDFNDWLTFYDFYTPGGDRPIYRFLREGGWGVKATVNNLVLFQKNYAGEFHIVERVIQPKMQYSLYRDVASGVKLLGFDLATERWEGNTLLDFSCYMQVTKRIPVGLLVNPQFSLHNEAEVGFRQPMFAPYRILPSSRWEPGEIYKQRCRILVPPDLPPGEYDLSFGLLLQNGREWEGKVVYRQQNVFQYK